VGGASDDKSVNDAAQECECVAKGRFTSRNDVWKA
jgi:hypothetical protein